MTLDDLGLVPTIKRFLDIAKERSGLITAVRLIGEERRLDSYVEVGIFRTIQEAVNNIEKHAQASLVNVVIEFRRDTLAVSVEDNGIGFDSAGNVGSESFGLVGMRERIHLLNGELTIRSVKGTGTKITIKVTLK